MKKTKIINYLMCLLLIGIAIGSVSAIVYEDNDVYEGTITSNEVFIPSSIPVNNANVIGYVCSNSACSSVQGTLWNGDVLNTGSDNSITLQYPTTLQSQYGYVVYLYKDGYIPWTFLADWAGSGNAPGGPYDNYVSRKEGCHAPINDFTVLNDVQPNVPLVVDISASLDATTYSALHCNTGRYLPDKLKPHVSVNTRVTLEIYNNNNKLVFSNTKDISLLCSSSKRVEFTWTPTVAGNYKAVAKTNINDEKCKSSTEDSTSKNFHVISEDPRNMCYTLLNNLVLSNPFPWEGETVDVSGSKISNHADDNYILTPVATDLKYTIKRRLDGAIVYSKNEHISANSDTETPRQFSFAWDTTGHEIGFYDIDVYGKANDPKCAGLENLGEKVSVSAYLDSHVTYAPDLDGLPDKQTEENYPSAHLSWINLWDYTTDPDTDLKDMVYKIVSESNTGLIDCYIDNGHYISCKAPTAGKWGYSNIIVEVADGEYSDRDSFSVTVTPINDRPLISNIPNVEFPENSCYSLDLDDYVSDPDNTDAELVWSVSGNNNVDITINPTTHVTKFCAYDWYGQETVTFKVKDPEGLSDTDNVVVIVTHVHVNQPPVISDIPDVEFYDNSCYELDLDNYVSDPDNTKDELTWTVTGDDYVEITIDPVTHIAEFCAYDWNGKDTVKFKVTDHDGESDSDYVVVTVLPVLNEPPKICYLSDITFPEDTCYELDLDNYVHDPDNSKDELIWGVSDNYNVEITIDPVTHVAEFCGKPDWNGAETVLFTVTDPGLLSDSEDMLVTVTPVNDAPVISDIPDVEFEENSCYSLDLDNYVSDPDNTDSELVWSVSGNNNVDISINPSTHEAEFCSYDWYGQETVTFKVKDPEGLFDTDTVKVTVTHVHVNQPPVISDIPDVELYQNTCHELDLDLYVSDPDHANDELTWSVTGEDYVDISIDPETHIAEICANDWTGQDTVKFKVTDPDGASDSDYVIVTVLPVQNEPPKICNLPDISFPEDTCNSLDLDDYAYDPDNLKEELTWGVSGNYNIDITIDPVSHVAEFCGKPDWNGEETVLFTVTDPGMLSDSEDMLVTVTPVNDAPVISDIPDVEFDENSCFELDLDYYVSDPDNTFEELTWSVTGNDNVDITINPVTHVAEFCAYDWYGVEDVLFTVKDPSGSTDSDDVKVTVTHVIVNLPPVLNIPDRTVEENSGHHDNLIDLWQYAGDETPDNELVFTLTGQSNPEIVICSLDSNRYIDCETQPDMFGGSDVTVSVSDGEFTVYDTFRVNVLEVQDGEVTVTVLYPNGGEVLRGLVNILWTAETTNDCSEDMLIKVEYSPDKGYNWYLIADNEENDGVYEWDTTDMKDLATYLIKVTATDCKTSGYDISDGYFTINNNPVDDDDVIRPDYEIYIKSIVFENPNGDMPEPGEELQILITIRNVGDTDLDNVRIKVFSDELGEIAYSGPFPLDEGDQVTKRLMLWVPDWAPQDEYPLRITVTNDRVKRVVYRFINVV